MPVTEWLTPAMLLALGGLMWRGFERLSTRIDRLESRLDRLDAKVDGGFARLDTKVDSIAERLQTVALDVAVLKERDKRDDRPSRAANG